MRKIDDVRRIHWNISELVSRRRSLAILLLLTEANIKLMAGTARLKLKVNVKKPCRTEQFCVIIN